MIPAIVVVLCALARVLPHPQNFAPVGAVAVFAGRTLRTGPAIALTVGAMAASNLLLDLVNGWPLFGVATLFVHAGFVAQVLLGRALRRRRGGALAAAGLGACSFFVLSNLGVWVGGMYGYGWAGLVTCYVAAIPFFAGTLAGDLLWTAALSLAWSWLARWQNLETDAATV